MATLGQLRYMVGAADTGFRRLMDDAQRKLRGYGQTVRQTRQWIDEKNQSLQRGATTLRNWSLAASAAGTAAAYAAKRIVDSSAQTASAIDLVSKQTGVGTTALQGYHYAAEQAGIGTDTLNSSLRSMARRMSSAAQGNQQYISTLARIGMTQEDVIEGLHDVDELFLQIVEGISQLPTEAERSEVAMTLMGDAGRRLGPLFAMGREGVEAMTREAERLGIVIEEDNIARFAEYDEAITRFRAGLTGLRNVVATALLPVMEQITNRATEGVSAFGQWLRENKELVAQGAIMGSMLAAIALGLGLVGTGASIGIRALGLLASTVTFLLSPMGLLIGASAALVIAWQTDWMDIRTTTLKAVDYIRGQWDRLMLWWEEGDLPTTVRELWSEVQEVWNDPELTLTDKIVRSVKITAEHIGLNDLWADVLAAWNDPENLKLTDKVVSVVRVVAERIGLDELWEKVEAVWQDPERTLSEKVIDTLQVTAEDVGFTLAATITGAIILARIASALSSVAGVAVATVQGNTLRLGIAGMALALAIYGWRLWNAAEEGEEELQQEVTDIVHELLGAGIALSLAIASFQWAGMTADLVRNALIRAWAATRLGWARIVSTGTAIRLGMNIAGLTLALAAVWFSLTPEAQGEIKSEVDDLRDHIAQVWAENPLRLPIELFFEIPELIRRIADIIASDIWGDEPALTPEQRQSIEESGIRTRERLRDFFEGLQFWKETETSEESPASMVDDVTSAIIEGHPHLEAHRDVLEEMAERLVAIGEAKEAPLTLEELAEVMALLLSESSTVLGDLEAMENPLRVTSSGFDELNRSGVELIEITAGLNRNLEAGLELFRLYKAEFGDPALAAGAFLFPSFARAGEWDRTFGREGTDVTGMTAGMKAERFNELLGGIFEGGRSIGIEWAKGLRSTVPDAEDAADEMAGSVADYLIGRSPPPKGELSDVDEPKVGETWVQAIAREIEEEGGTLEAAVRVIADRMWTGMMSVLEERWPGAAEFIRGLIDGEGGLQNAVDKLGVQIDDLVARVKELDDRSIQWTNNLVQGISDALVYGRSLTDVFDNFLRMLASQFLQSQVFGPLLHGFLPGVLSGLPLFHSGGLVLGGAGVAVMHNGGLIQGLRHDEVPIIAQVGERMLSRAQNDRFEQMLEEGRDVHHHYYIEAVDAKSFADLVARNPEAIKIVTLQDIMGNGDIRKAIQSVSRA